MHITRSKVRRGNKVYEYTRLVRSVRNAKGTPSHEVVANLTDWTPLEIDNLDRALRAARAGKTVVAEAQGHERPHPMVSLSLDYLDLALVLELWRERGLGELLDGLVDDETTTVPFSSVVASLVAQRIVAPDSKLAAQRWFPQTALCELLDLPIGQFNNSRVHRTLEQLEAIEVQLQSRLASRCARRRGFSALYLDSTDTFFVGGGPDKATFGKTKEGRNERKVGVLLLCNERGEPLRWKVVEGRSADNLMFRDTFAQLATVDWARDVPIVVDRAMGSTADIRAMSETGLQFLTALRATEFSKYTNRIPRTAIAQLQLPLDGSVAGEKAACSLLAQTALNHGFECINPDLYVLDLGVREIGDVDGQLAVAGAFHDLAGPDTVAKALEVGSQIQQGLDDGTFANQVEAARHFAYGKTWISRRLQLARLPRTVQDDIARGGAEHIGLVRLSGLAQMPSEQQAKAYNELKRTPRSKYANNRPSRLLSCSSRAGEPLPLMVRQLLYFRPSLHLEKRRNFNNRVDEAFAFVAALNDDVAKGRTRRSPQRLIAQVEQELARLKLSQAFTIKAGNGITLEEVESEMTSRRGRFGFAILVGHPDLTESAQRLVERYRAKNAVEYDFKLIKSVLEIRPVRHRTDEKVAAHVTLCVLALLLLRALEEKMAGTGLSPSAILEALASCRLSRIELNAKNSYYAVTQPTRLQSDLLHKLDLEHLTEAPAVAERIHPRP